MAQLSEKLVRDAIKCIREERKLMLTINEVDQALHAWLTLNDLVQPPPLAAAETSATKRCKVCGDQSEGDFCGGYNCPKQQPA